MKKATELLATDRTSHGLREALFETLDSLRRKTITPQQASAVSKVAAQIINSVTMEIEFHKAVVRTGDSLEFDNARALKPLMLTSSTERSAS